MKIEETRKEENYYYQGPFWIIANHYAEIHQGDFSITGARYLSDYNGDYCSEDVISKAQRTHKKVWADQHFDKIYDKEWDYYPRGRVAIYKGKAWIHINSKCNIPSVINKIIETYEISRLDVDIECNDETQGPHYAFKLK